MSEDEKNKKVRKVLGLDDPPKDDYANVHEGENTNNDSNTGKPILEEDYKDDEKNKAAQKELGPIKDSGPVEAVITRTTGHHPPASEGGSMELAMMEICPHCEDTLRLYYTRDVLSGEKIMRCKNCGTILVQSANGWVEKTTAVNERKVGQKFPQET